MTKREKRWHQNVRKNGYKYATGKINNRRTTRYHKTYEQAVARIERVKKKDPVGLYAGDYYLDPLVEC